MSIGRRPGKWWTLRNGPHPAEWHRNGSRALLAPRRRIDRTLLAVVMEAYVHGTSTRRVDDLVKTLSVNSGISKSEVSWICAELDGEVPPSAPSCPCW